VKLSQKRPRAARTGQFFCFGCRTKVIMMTPYVGRARILSLGMNLIATAFLLFCLPVRAQTGRPPTLESDVAPVLKEHCLMCHGEIAPQAGPDLRTRESLLKGGKSGPALVPGSSDRSLLVDKIASKSMPPGEVKLSDKEIALIRLWIDKGAVGSGAGTGISPKKAATDLVSENEVTPIFQLRCTGCHGKRRQEGGLDLRTQASRLKGGKSGPALIPGRPEESLLMKRIVAGEMPPPKLLYEYAVRPPTRTTLPDRHPAVTLSMRSNLPTKSEVCCLPASNTPNTENLASKSPS
jgi:hypothetical protein